MLYDKRAKSLKDKILGLSETKEIKEEEIKLKKLKVVNKKKNKKK